MHEVLTVTASDRTSIDEIDRVTVLFSGLQNVVRKPIYDVRARAY
jgi:hypothetical protein